MTGFFITILSMPISNVYSNATDSEFMLLLFVLLGLAVTIALLDSFLKLKCMEYKFNFTMLYSKKFVESRAESKNVDVKYLSEEEMETIVAEIFETALFSQEDIRYGIRTYFEKYKNIPENEIVWYNSILANTPKKRKK